MRGLLSCLAILVLACSSSTPAPAGSPSPSPEGGLGGPGLPSRWVFASALLLPPDPNTYADVITGAVPLADGGWIVLHAPTARPRFNCDPSTYGCGLVRPPLAVLQRLDARGRVVAEERGSEPFALDRIHVFEDLDVVVGAGPQVLNASLHAFSLGTLSGVASELAPGCIAVNDRCYSARPDHLRGVTTLEERDARTLRLVRSAVVPFLSGAAWSPAIFAASNVVAWRTAATTRPFVRVTRLDESRPMLIPWLARLESACDVVRLTDDRALVFFGPSSCRGETGWSAELVEVSTGRVIRALDTSVGVSGDVLIGAGQVELADGVLVDPRDGADGPVIMGRLLSVNWHRGIAVVALSDGGAAVLERRPAADAVRDLPFRTVESAACVEYDMPRVMAARSDLVTCPGLRASAGARRLLVATGRGAFSPASFVVARVALDSGARTIDVIYLPAGRRSNVTDPSPSAVVEVDGVPSGEWLVRFGTADSAPTSAFVVRF